MISNAGTPGSPARPFLSEYDNNRRNSSFLHTSYYNLDLLIQIIFLLTHKHLPTILFLLELFFFGLFLLELFFLGLFFLIWRNEGGVVVADEVGYVSEAGKP
jgi:hypothetical protein